MSVDTSTVLEMAALARLRVPEDKLRDVAVEMDAILAFMGQIAAFEGADNAEPEPAVRRPDKARKTSVAIAFQEGCTDASGAVIVPPVKGAS